MNGTWAFTYTNGDMSREIPETCPADSEFSCVMPVPGYWDDHLDSLRQNKLWKSTRFYTENHEQIKFPMGESPRELSIPFLQGIGWYKKRFTVPARSKAILYIGGVMVESRIWINGECVGSFFGHSVPFEIELSNIMPGKENELVIAVSNLRGNERSGCIIRGYKKWTGGIYRSVKLRITGQTYFTDIYLFPDRSNNRLNWQVELNRRAVAEKLQVKWFIKELDTCKIIKSGIQLVSGKKVQWTCNTKEIKPWSDRDPQLYRMELVLVKDKERLDVCVRQWGMRRLSAHGFNLQLNKKPVYLRGVTEHAYFPETCTAPNQVSYYRKIIQRLKTLGFNWIRFHTWVPSEEYMQAADELGMMIQVEPPAGFSEKEWIDILRVCRNHPSVVIYCCGNEGILHERKLKQLRKMSGLCHTHAPDALFNPQEALHGVVSAAGKESLGKDMVEEPYPHNPRRLKLLLEFSDVLGLYAWSQFSYRSCEGSWRMVDKRAREYKKPNLGHEVGIHGTYIDLGLEQRYKGTRIGTGMYKAAREYLEQQGLIKRAALYYHNSCALHKSIRKHTIELIRKSSTHAGYDYLGAIDHHWHRCGYPCGIMNEFYELKPGNSIEEILQHNNESVLLLDYSYQRNFRTGQAISLDLMLSHFGTKDIRNAKVNWYISDKNGHIYERRGFPLENFRAGMVKKIHTLKFMTPELSKPECIAVNVRLSDSQHELNNSWDFWVFPKEYTRQKSAKAGNVHIVTEIDDSIINILKQGGRVVLFGSKPFPVLPVEFRQAMAGRALGNVASVIEDHWITSRFPHNGFCDWQFYDMLQNSNAIVFNDFPKPFKPIIEIVSSFKLIKKQAALFELQVDNGKLLVCTLNLDKKNPAASYLKHTILQYAESDNFQPEIKLGADMFVDFLYNNDSVSREILKTDEAFDEQGRIKKK